MPLCRRICASRIKVVHQENSFHVFRHQHRAKLRRQGHAERPARRLRVCALHAARRGLVIQRRCSARCQGNPARGIPEGRRHRDDSGFSRGASQAAAVPEGEQFRLLWKAAWHREVCRAIWFRVVSMRWRTFACTMGSWSRRRCLCCIWWRSFACRMASWRAWCRGHGPTICL